MTPLRPEEWVARGRVALSRGEWEEAQAAFEAGFAESQSPDALEGLGWALWWLDRPEPSLATRERAYLLHLRGGDPLAAARVAIGLAVDAMDVQGESVTAGWLGRARAILDRCEPGVGHGWLALWEGQFDLFCRRDVSAASRRAAEAAEIARRFAAAELDLLASALEGLVRVARGEVAEGMRRLDAALVAALAGEIGDLDSVGATCCLLVHACERTRDGARAEQWHRKMEAFARRWRVSDLLAVCRIEFAALRLWQGAWAEAEAELGEAITALERNRPAAAAEALALLGELRRRQGRLAEAEALFGRCPHLSLSLLGQSAIEHERSRDPLEALRRVDRALSRVAPDNFTVRAAGHELALRLALATGDTERARAESGSLAALSAVVDVPAFRAAESLAAGLLLAAEGETDAAIARLEEACALFLGAGAPFEAARTRLDLAAQLEASGRAAAGAAERAAALATFAALGAALPEEPNAVSPSRPDRKPGGTRRENGGPSARELEVLRLVAEGLSDREIAVRLHRSEHTVHRHVANLLARLDCGSRAAAVAKAARLGLL